MSSLTYNFLNYLSGSNKTHDELDAFVNKKFTFFLNNSNLLLNFVSDFEDYKTTNTVNPKNRCDECEELFILTSDIFEKYFNKVTIPYNIDITNNIKETPSSKTNYQNKVLYFFDLKDLKKILSAEDLKKSNPDTLVFNKKRVLCKIIALSFIKIYIIVKSIHQTFNIYNSLIKKEVSVSATSAQDPQLNKETDVTLAIPIPIPTQEPQLNKEADVTPAIPTQDPQLNKEAGIKEEQIVPITTQDSQLNKEEGIKEEQTATTQDQQLKEENKQSGGGIFGDMFYSLTGKPKNISTPANETTNISTNSIDDNAKLQTSSNIFYSLFVILFANSEIELSATNFNAKFLTDGVNNITNEKLSEKIPKIIEYICIKNIYAKDFIGNSYIIFRDDNFKFMKLQTSDTEQTEATELIQQIDNESGNLDEFIARKKGAFEQSLSKETTELLLNYCKTVNSLKFEKKNDMLFNKIRKQLINMIKEYFAKRVELYNIIVKEIFVFDSKTHDIISLKSNLTYKSITELTKITKIKLLELHIAVFKPLDVILSEIASEIKTMKITEQPPTTEDKPPTTEDKPPTTEDKPPTTEVTQPITGGKTIKRRKNNKNKSRKNKKNKRKNKNKSISKKQN
jgi:hypothetical protein